MSSQHDGRSDEIFCLAGRRLTEMKEQGLHGLKTIPSFPGTQIGQISWQMEVWQQDVHHAA
eukprot:5205993-Amphidinium_carterae.1